MASSRDQRVVSDGGQKYRSVAGRGAPSCCWPTVATRSSADYEDCADRKYGEKLGDRKLGSQTPTVRMTVGCLHRSHHLA